MSLSAKAISRLKRVHPRDELLACGFVRANSKKNLALEIIQICMLFFISCEEWDMEYKGKWLEISGPFNQFVEYTNPQTNPSCQSAIGSLRVSSGKHHWKFKLTKIDLSTKVTIRIAIGIINMNEVTESDLKDMKDTFLSNAHGLLANVHDSTCFTMEPKSGGTSLSTYGTCFNKVGDILDMYLDLDNGKLCFAVNDEYYGHIYDQEEDPDYVIEKVEYKMGLTLNGVGTAVELVSYEEMEEIP